MHCQTTSPLCKFARRRLVPTSGDFLRAPCKRSVPAKAISEIVVVEGQGGLDVEGAAGALAGRRDAGVAVVLRRSDRLGVALAALLPPASIGQVLPRLTAVS